MAKGKLTFFPVGNGDMTLLETESGKKILMDVNITGAADDPDGDAYDAMKELRSRLVRDVKGRLFINVFLLSHPDQDHCRGFEKHFHVGDPDSWSKTDDKIFINEIWSSPMVFRRASKNHVLCEDAKAFNSEARRRVVRYKEGDTSLGAGIRL